MMRRQQFGGAYLHRTLADQAAAHPFHLRCRHPFKDGNKRISVMSSLVFLDANGVQQLPDQESPVQVARSSEGYGARDRTRTVEPGRPEATLIGCRCAGSSAAPACAGLV
jgi:prophage maintenance system killer protein